MFYFRKASFAQTSSENATRERHQQPKPTKHQQSNINSQTSPAEVSNCNLFISIYSNIILKMERQIIVEFLNLFIISWIHLWKERICYNEQLLITILTKYNFSVEIMHALDISNYLTPRYLAELIDNNEYYINLRNYGERYDWDLSMALETLYLEIGLRQCGLPPEIILKII